jgi:RNA polymerase sigma-70 factor (ECF subfamily)
MIGYSKLSNDELAALFKKKDIAAFDLLFEKFYQPLCFFASRIVQDNFSAEDIVQDVFVKLWEKENIPDTLSSLRAYLYASVKNSCFNYLDKNVVKLKYEQHLSNHLQDDSTILQTIIQAEVLRQIFDAVDTLPAQCRKIMRMTFEDGLKAQEIAKELGITVSTVNNQKMRGLSLLKNRLSDEGLTLSLLLFLPEIIERIK